MNKIVVGQVLKAQGILGEVKIKALTDDSKRFKKLKEVYVGGEVRKILSIRIAVDYVFIKFQGIDNRDDAEKIANKIIEIDRADAVPLDEGSYFISDLLGMSVLSEDGEKFGEIIDISSNGAADVITMKLNDKIYMFPFLNRIVKSVNILEKSFIVYRELLMEVCLFED